MATNGPPQAPATLFPLVRHLSYRLTPLLARLPISPNQITLLSLVAALGASALYVVPGYRTDMAGALLFVFAYVLDNCDGEIARLKGLSSAFGAAFDTFVDWLGHGVLFVALGIATQGATGEPVWLWLGLLGAFGATVNYGLSLLLARRAAPAGPAVPDEITPPPPGVGAYLLYAFRELSRADFCFIVLALTLFEGQWLLLPAVAIGAQVYWLTAFIKSARRYHV